MEKRSPRKLGYTRQWDIQSKDFRRRNPLCAMCQAEGRTTLAYCVDHKVPHKGNKLLFWDQTNWQSLCQICHNKVKQGIEVRGYKLDIGKDGWPVDPGHPANKVSHQKVAPRGRTKGSHAI